MTRYKEVDIEEIGTALERGDKLFKDEEKGIYFLRVDEKNSLEDHMKTQPSFSTIDIEKLLSRFGGETLVVSKEQEHSLTPVVVIKDGKMVENDRNLSLLQESPRDENRSMPEMRRNC